jgi:hypothetical protein
MSRKPKLIPSTPRKILLEALNHPEFFNDLPLLTLENNQLFGVIVVNEVDRVSLLISAFERYKNLEYKGEEPYDDLEVANGGMAQEAFAELMQLEVTTERYQQLYEALLKYCERDTLAMVRIAHYFEDGKSAT